MTAYFQSLWFAAFVIAGISYGSIGIVFALPSNYVRMWRLAAWGACGIVYLTHIAYERYRLGNRPLVTALHTAAAVALGGFLLAAGAIVHATMVSSHAPYWRFGVALMVWPLITAVPAFLVSLALAFLLPRLPTNRPTA
jgi:hypothetical protein